MCVCVCVLAPPRGATYFACSGRQLPVVAAFAPGHQVATQRGAAAARAWGFPRTTRRSPTGRCALSAPRRASGQFEAKASVMLSADELACRHSRPGAAPHDAVQAARLRARPQAPAQPLRSPRRRSIAGPQTRRRLQISLPPAFRCALAPRTLGLRKSLPPANPGFSTVFYRPAHDPVVLSPFVFTSGKLALEPLRVC